MVDWKKEIKLSDLVRRGGKDKGEEPVAEPEPVAEKTSIWKKEISLGRKKRTEAEPEPEAVPEQPTPQAPPPAEAPTQPIPTIGLAAEERPQPAVEESPPAPVVPLHPAAPAPIEQPVQPAAPTPAPQPPAPAAAQPSAPQQPPVQPQHPPAPAQQTPAPPPQPVVPQPQVPAAAPPPPLPGIHPPVPAAELHEEPRSNKTPFWKKELSLGRKRTTKTVEPDDEYAPKKPFWKKELSLGRKGSAQPKPKRERKSWPARRERGGGKGAKRLVGLKIGASQLAAARVSNNGVPELLQLARESLPAGVVAGGELRDPEALATALRAFFRKHKLPRRGVRLGIANNRIGVRTFDVSGIDDAKQLDNAIRFRAQEALPIPIEEAVLDYQVLGEAVDEEGVATKRILLVVAYRELIDRYVAACRKAGIRLVGIDLEAFALLRALGEPRPEDAGQADAAVVAVAIGHERSTFAVSDGRTCEFTRVLDWGGASLDVAVARELDLTPSQAEPIKRMLSLEPGAGAPDGMTEEQAGKAREAIRRQLQAFARELVSSLQFYQNQPGSLGIGEIVVTGGTAHLPGIATELQRLIGVLVRVGDPLGRVKIGRRVGDDDQIGSLAVAIGLGIED